MDKRQTPPADDTIDILELLRDMWANKWLLILLAFIGAAAAYVYTAFFTPDTYTVTGLLYVSNKSDAELSQGNAITKSDIDTSRTLTTTYMEILQTTSFLEDVAKDTNNLYTWKDIKKSVALSTANDTELLNIRVTTYSANSAYIIAESFLKNAPQKLLNIFKNGEVEIVDPARPPEAPNSKEMPKKVAIGGMLGLLIGAAYVFLKNFFNTKIRRSEDIEKKYNISILGQILQTAVPKKKGAAVIDSGMEHILNSATDFDTVETYKTIRTNIMFSIPRSDKGKVIIVTSSSPGEGKTTTSVNLAITFAQTGAKVILVDCDLRKSRVHRYLQLDRKAGVSNVLCGFTPLDTTIKYNVRDNLDVLTAGEIPPNPAELIESDAFASLLDTLSEKYDYVFIDTPPLSIVTDAAVAMRKSQGVVIVTRQNVTTFDLLDITVDSIRRTKTKILGTVVLDSTEKQRKYGYYNKKYGYKYRYKYNYNYNYKYEDTMMDFAVDAAVKSEQENNNTEQ